MSISAGDNIYWYIKLGYLLLFEETYKITPFPGHKDLFSVFEMCCISSRLTFQAAVSNCFKRPFIPDWITSGDAKA